MKRYLLFLLILSCLITSKRMIYNLLFLHRYKGTIIFLIGLNVTRCSILNVHTCNFLFGPRTLFLTLIIQMNRTIDIKNTNRCNIPYVKIIILQIEVHVETSNILRRLISFKFTTGGKERKLTPKKFPAPFCTLEEPHQSQRYKR